MGPEDLHNVTKEKKQANPKSNDELEIKDEASKQIIDNKEECQKKSENDKLRIDTDEAIDITKDTSKESQNDIASSIEQSSVHDVLKDLAYKDQQDVKKENEQVDTVSNDKPDNEKTKDTEMTTANNLPIKITDAVDSTDEQNQMLNSNALKIQKGLEETNVTSNEISTLQENVSQELQDVSIENKEQLLNNEISQSDSND